MLRVTGTEQLRQVGVDLRAAPRQMRTKLRRNIVAATAPITIEAKSKWRDTYGHLGAALAKATGTRVLTAGRNVGVSIRVSGSRLPPGKQGLGWYVEALGRPWRHPLFGDRNDWYGQAAHPEIGPAVKRHLPGVQVAVLEAVSATAEELAHGF